MAEVINDEFDSLDAAIVVGGKVIEMCDRLASMQMIVPGAQASVVFNIDGIDFKLVAEVVAA